MSKRPRFFYGNGPTCVGKGFLLKLIQRNLARMVESGAIRVHYVLFGDIVKDLLVSDFDFNEKYGPVIKAGDLVEDPKAIEIFRAQMDALMDDPPDLIFIDGFCRSIPQIAYAANNGYLGRGDKVFMIEASLQTCLDRFLHRKAKAERQRVDAEMATFHKRYHLHTEMAPELRAMFKEVDCELVDIDGNPDIAEFVSPSIMGHILPDIAWAASARRGENPSSFRLSAVD